MIKKIRQMYLMYKFKKATAIRDSVYDFVWGIKSLDGTSDCEEANFTTMNDLEIIYNKKENKYLISIETIYLFTNGIEGEKEYLRCLLNQFTAWMQNQGYNLNVQMGLYDIFTAGINITSKFDTIEELYGCFKLLVNGYINH